MKQWIGNSAECIATTGWSVLAQLAKDNGDLSDAELCDWLAVIEHNIHSEKTAFAPR